MAHIPSVNTDVEIEPAKDTSSPSRKITPTRKDLENREIQATTGRNTIPFADAHQDSEQSVQAGAVADAQQRAKRRESQLHLKRQPQKQKGDIRPSSPRPVTPSLAWIARDRMAHAVPAAPATARGSSVVEIDQAAFSGATPQRDSIRGTRKNSISLSQQLITASETSQVVNDDGGNDEVRFEQQSSVPNGEDNHFRIYNHDEQCQPITYAECGKAGNVGDNKEGSRDSHPQRDDKLGQIYGPPDRDKTPEGPDRDAERGSRRLRRRRRSSSISSQDRPSKRRRHHDSDSDTRRDSVRSRSRSRTLRRRRLFDTKRAINLLTQAVNHLSLLTTLPAPLSVYDISKVHLDVQKERWLTEYGKAVMMRKLCQEGMEKDAREYLDLRDERGEDGEVRRDGVRREWWAFAFPEGSGRGWFSLEEDIGQRHGTKDEDKHAAEVDESR